MKLSIEELKKMRKHSASLCHDSYVSALDELIAIREREGDPVPVAYFAAAPDYGWDMFKNKEDAIATCQAEIDAYRDCRDDGWDDDVQRVCWGVVLQKAEGFDQQGIHTSNSHHTYQTCDYSLQPELFTTPQKPVVLPVVPHDFVLRTGGKQIHFGVDARTGESLWHTRFDGSGLWCGHWYDRTLQELESECISTLVAIKAAIKAAGGIVKDGE